MERSKITTELVQVGLAKQTTVPTNIIPSLVSYNYFQAGLLEFSNKLGRSYSHSMQVLRERDFFFVNKIVDRQTENNNNNIKNGK